MNDVIDFLYANGEHYIDGGISDIQQVNFTCNSSNDIRKFIISNGRSSKSLIIKKVYFDQMYNEAYIEYINLKRCFSCFDGEAYGVPKLLKSPIDKGVLITEESPGVTCKKIVVENCKYFNGSKQRLFLSGIISNCGKWLREYHKIGMNQLDSLGAQADVMEYSNKFILMQSKIVESMYTKSPLLKKVAHKYGLHTEEKLISLLNIEPTLIHGDFGPGNIISNGTNVTVLDFSYLAFVSKYFDVGQFLSSLDTINPYPANFLYSKKYIEKLKEIFLFNYFNANSIDIYSIEYIEKYYMLNILRQYKRHTQFILNRYGITIAKFFDVILSCKYIRDIYKNAEFLRKFMT